MIDVVAVMSVVLTTVTVWRAAALWQRIGELKPRGRQETGRYKYSGFELSGFVRNGADVLIAKI